MTSPEQVRWLEWRFPGGAPWADRVRSGRRRTLGVGLAVGVVGGAGWIYLLDRIAGRPDGGRSTDLPVLQESASWVLLVAGVACIVVGIVRQSRDGEYAAAATSPLWALSMRQRRSVMRAIRGAEPVHPIDVPFLRDVAARSVMRSGPRWLFAGLLLTQVGGLLREPDLRGALVLSFTAAIVGWVLLQTWRARRFLARYPAGAGGTALDAANALLLP